VSRVIPLPPRHDLARILGRLSVDDGDVDEILAGWPRAGDPAGREALERAYDVLVKDMGGFGPIEQPAPPPDRGPFGRYFYAYVYLAALGEVDRYHRRHGVPEDVGWATLADLGRNLRRDRRLFGEGGLRTYAWLSLHFRGGIYELGRLQFNRMRLRAVHAGGGLREGDDALGVHIYEGRSLDPAACDASLARAREFFGRHFPETPVRVAACASWLLDEQLAEYLPAESNIIRFQRRFHLVGSVEGDHDILRFVFGRIAPDLDELPQRTTLERAVVAHLRAGKHWRTRVGWLEL
jgi:hypothetical protein